jgi:hypothetical protein
MTEHDKTARMKWTWAILALILRESQGSQERGLMKTP